MIPAQRVVLWILLAFLLGMAGVFLWRRAERQSAPAPTPAPTLTPSPAPPTSTPTAVAAPPGYRLAGTAMGGPTAYAAIEAPGGNMSLYKRNTEIPDTLNDIPGVTSMAKAGVSSFKRGRKVSAITKPQSGLAA